MTVPFKGAQSGFQMEPEQSSKADLHFQSGNVPEKTGKGSEIRFKRIFSQPKL